MKLDSKVYGTLFKAKDDQRIPDDEYVVFRPADNAFAEMLPFYREACVRNGSDAEQVAAVDRLIARVQAWRAAHPERCKAPDAAGERLLAFDTPTA